MSGFKSVWCYGASASHFPLPCPTRRCTRPPVADPAVPPNASCRARRALPVGLPRASCRSTRPPFSATAEPPSPCFPSTVAAFPSHHQPRYVRGRHGGGNGSSSATTTAHRGFRRCRSAPPPLHVRAGLWFVVGFWLTYTAMTVALAPSPHPGAAGRGRRIFARRRLPLSRSPLGTHLEVRDSRWGGGRTK